jgi:septal ring factor EnvC (AmiA/AmiB activator)
MLQMLSLIKNKKCLWVILVIGMLFGCNVMAKDISDEQYQVRMAQKEYDTANRDHQVLADSIKELEKRIAQQAQQLEVLKKGLPAKEDRLNKAQKALEEKQLVLDKAWEENKR